MSQRRMLKHPSCLSSVFFPQLSLSPTIFFVFSPCLRRETLADLPHLFEDLGAFWGQVSRPTGALGGGLVWRTVGRSPKSVRSKELCGGEGTQENIILCEFLEVWGILHTCRVKELLWPELSSPSPEQGWFQSARDQVWWVLCCICIVPCQCLRYCFRWLGIAIGTTWRRVVAVVLLFCHSCCH